jgi:hypothetical protein
MISRPNGSQPASRTSSTLPVAVIGGGPVGLAAAAHLVEAGLRPLLFEAGDRPGSAVRQWAHVQLFSPWRYVVAPLVSRLLVAEGWTPPNPDELPTGGALVRDLLEPIATLPSLKPHLHFGTRVEAISRRGIDKVRNDGREATPFEVHTREGTGATKRHLVRAVIDASGTWQTPNPAGVAGLPAVGERAHRDRITYGLPDCTGAARGRYAGRTVLVVGSGHSAFQVVGDLSKLRTTEPETRIVWAIRRREPGTMFGGGTRDALPARGRLGMRLRALVEEGAVDFVTGFRIHRIRESGDGRLRVTDLEGRVLGPIDEIVAATGFRPDHSILRELRVEVDPVLEAPVRLAPMIDPNLHSCGTVPPHNFEVLAHPEPNLYVVGMKSYGRAPTFLLMTGYEQVRSVVQALAGNLDAARRVALTLPETGVCSTDASHAEAFSQGGLPVAPARGTGSPTPAPPSPPACCG